MFYKFPTIHTADDVVPLIKDNPNFHINDKGDYFVINYYMLGNETFPDIFFTGGVDGHIDYESDAAKIMRECRGIAFNRAGDIISRPFHKFFNYGERKEVENVTRLPAHVLEKLDGSMVRPLYFDNMYRLGTKAGITDVSMQAEVYIADLPKYSTFIEFCRLNSATPIFEWTSRQQKIILDYKEDALVLLAVRHMITGEYWSRGDLIDCSNSFGIPLVDEHIISTDTASIVANAKAKEDSEGYVMVFSDGHMLKAKSEWYVTLHRSKEAVSREREVIKLILNEGLDDLYPILMPEDKEKVQKFSSMFLTNLGKTEGYLLEKYADIMKTYSLLITEDMDYKNKRKTFAILANQICPEHKSFMFSLYDGKILLKVLCDTIKKNLGNRASCDNIRWIFGDIRYEETLDDDSELRQAN